MKKLAVGMLPNSTSILLWARRVLQQELGLPAGNQPGSDREGLGRERQCPELQV